MYIVKYISFKLHEYEDITHILTNNRRTPVLYFYCVISPVLN